MRWRSPTHRTVAGQRIDGAWCHVWLRRAGGTHAVEDLLAFADGTIHCGRSTDLAGLRRMLESGEIALTDPAADHSPAGGTGQRGWRSRAPEPLTPEGFLLDVADRIEALAGRPTAADRCWAAIRDYLRDPVEARRQEVRAAYLAVPPHRRVYVLGDMDAQDRPLRILTADLGTVLGGDGPVATEELRREAHEYFTQTEEAVERERRQRAVQHADDPPQPPPPAVTLNQTVFPSGWPDRLGTFALRNDYPAPIDVEGEVYPSVQHAYWALSTAQAADRTRVREAPSTREAQERGGRARRRPDWPAVRLAVMADLLRAKFTQHPDLAEVLLSTGEAPISYTGFSDSPYWLDDPDGRGRNWMGRLLELVRAELRLRPPGPPAP
ncbi:NADAR family protein [Streptomonospora sp. S1-112]|uniref:NADAR family protein n=1 Tax=Streptomonospora mangrovi TaxID=2883123 RepID=A0A9X3SDA2_9ACTN|nr:NADAR family protein [Streptomonospora mangrovi]MDA0564568.1 NADAR family protein [Streptomonospora mangrovi]